jgi:RsiW-degrading membrane proteinase PrsW (M82 family)
METEYHRVAEYDAGRMHPVEQWAALAVAAAAAVAWMFYFRWKDHVRPEPLWLTSAAVGGGAMAVALAHFGFSFAETVWTPTRWEDLQSGDLLFASLAAFRIGAVEEVCKLAVVLPIALKARAFDEVLDGIVYAACAALGFATAETVVQFAHGSWVLEDALARAVAAGLTHALLAAPWGLGLALAVLKKRRSALVLGLGTSVAAHAAYDFLLARPELSPMASAGLVLALWAWMIVTARKLQRAPPAGAAVLR